MLHLERLMHPSCGCAIDCYLVAAGILPAVEGGILPPNSALEGLGTATRRATVLPSEKPDLMLLKSVVSFNLDQQRRQLTAQNLPGGIETNQPVRWLPRKCTPLPGDPLRMLQAVNFVCSRERHGHNGLVGCQDGH
jgi:hypothetical protein